MKSIFTGKPLKQLRLSDKHNKTAGRNNSGTITAFHRGGGSKRLMRKVDLIRRQTQANLMVDTGVVERIEYDPNRTSLLALVRWHAYTDNHHELRLRPTSILTAPSEKALKCVKVSDKIKPIWCKNDLKSEHISPNSPRTCFSVLQQSSSTGVGLALEAPIRPYGRTPFRSRQLPKVVPFRQLCPSPQLQSAPTPVGRSHHYIWRGAPSGLTAQRALKGFQAFRPKGRNSPARGALINRPVGAPARGALIAPTYIGAPARGGTPHCRTTVEVGRRSDCVLPSRQALSVVRPAHSRFIFSYILACANLQQGQIIQNFSKYATLPKQHIFRDRPIFQIGNSVSLRSAPIGTLIHNVEINPYQGGKLVRAAGTFAQLVQNSGLFSTIRLPSGRFAKLDSRCRATVGIVSNTGQAMLKLTKAGQNRWDGKRPVVRGVAMNPVDHPHGGGEGRTKGGRPSVSPWGKPTKGGFKTRTKKGHRHQIP